MCEKCDELAISIARYRKFVSEGLDQVTTDGISELIAHLERRVAAMHPKEE